MCRLFLLSAFAALAFTAIGARAEDDSSNGVIVKNLSNDTLILIDTKAKKMLAYKWYPTKGLMLLEAKSFAVDLEIPDFFDQSGKDSKEIESRSKKAEEKKK